MIGVHLKTVFAATLIAFWCALASSNALAQPKPDPNAKFPVEFLVIKTSSGDFEFSVEIADEVVERSKGLMFRETMLPTHGMLFDFGETSTVSMWMQNTPLSLDMIFIAENGEVARIANDTVPFSQNIITSGKPVSHVLELNAGMARQIGLKEGDQIIHAYFNNQN